MEMYSVSKEDFDVFIKNYPRQLDCDVCAIAEPPLITYNDFSLGNWPESIVAKTWKYDDKPGERYYEPEEARSYFIYK
jgi:hypothetical protein